jgi:hypothetical protein
MAIRSEYAYHGHSSGWLFCFVYHCNIPIKDNSNTNIGGYPNFGYSYKLPKGYI